MPTRRTTLIAAVVAAPVAAVAVIMSLMAVSAATTSSAAPSSSMPAMHGMAGMKNMSAKDMAGMVVYEKKAGSTITISNLIFTVPKSVKPGATITVTNKDAVAHTVTSNKAGLFNVKAPAHKSVTFKAPKTAGSYAFHCAIHPSMHGTLKVK